MRKDFLDANPKPRETMRNRPNSTVGKIDVILALSAVLVLAASQFARTQHEPRTLAARDTVHNLCTMRTWLEIQSASEGNHEQGNVSEGDLAIDEPLPNLLTNSSAVTQLDSLDFVESAAIGTGGWLYHPPTGQIFIDHPNYVSR